MSLGDYRAPLAAERSNANNSMFSLLSPGNGELSLNFWLIRLERKRKEEERRKKEKKIEKKKEIKKKEKKTKIISGKHREFLKT